METTETTAITIVIPEASALPVSLLSNIENGFKSAFEQAEKWRQQALAINVTSLDQKAEMKLAHTIRCELKTIRVNAEKKRKELKEDSLRMGKAIDGVNNLLLAAIVPLEQHLEAQEKYAEKLKEAERQRILGERSEAIAPFCSDGQQIPPLDVMTPEAFQAFLADTKLLHEAKIEAARKAEAERIAREQAEAAERERLRLENERLIKEAAEREAAAKAEREKAEKEARDAAEQARKERQALEAAAKAEREKAEKELAAQRAAAAEAQRKADEAARKERVAIEAKARAEQEAAEAKAREERARREQLERDIAAQRAAEEEQARKEVAAKKKADAAPDKAKLQAIAIQVRALQVPTVTTTDGAAILAEITAKIESFAKWIETQASKL